MHADPIAFCFLSFPHAIRPSYNTNCTMITRTFFPQACELCRLSATSRSSLKSLHSMSASRAAVLPNHALSFARAGPSVATASSRHSISNTPKWSDESLSAVRDKYEAKYAERLKQKAKECVSILSFGGSIH